MRRVAAILLAPLLLVGCTESKATKLARCTMESMKISSDRYERLGFQNVCMRSEGYILTSDAKCMGYGPIDTEARCFQPANGIARALEGLFSFIAK